MRDRTRLCAALVCTLLAACESRLEKPPVDPPPPDATQQKAGRSQAASATPTPPPPPTRAERVRALMNETLSGTALSALGVDRAALARAPHYEIDLTVDFSLFTYRGTERLHLTNNEAVPLTELRFFLYPNVPELTGPEVKNLVVESVTLAGKALPFEIRGPAMRVTLPEPLAPGAELEVDLAFAGVIHRMPAQVDDLQAQAMDQLIEMVAGGLGGERQGHGYGVFSVSDGIVSLAMGYPQLAAYDQYGWDVDPGTEVGDRSYFDVGHFEVNITAPADVVVIATGLQRGRKAQGDQTTWRYAAAGVREFAMQLSRRYVKTSTRVGQVTVNSYSLAEHRAIGEQVLGQAARALEIFTADFGPYPYPELDVVEAPLVGGAGGVEFPGMVTIARMFYGPAGVGAPGQMGAAGARFLEETREFVVAHEVAHQWWNAVVGSDSKRHPFVDEALANHSAVHYFHRAYGPEAAERQTELQLRLNYHMARMAGGVDRPVDLPASDFGGMMEYAATVYAKGGLFFGAVREAIGERAFLSALQKYYRRFAFGIATPEQLVETLAKAHQPPGVVRQIARRWLHEAHGDEDIASMKVGTLLRQFGGDEILRQLDPRLLTLVEHRGASELGRLLQQLIDPSAPPGQAVDHGAIVDLLGQLLAADDRELSRMISAAGRLLSHAQADGQLRPSVLMREIGQELAGDDPQTRMMMEAMGMMFEALTHEGGHPGAAPPPYGAPPRHRQPLPW